MLFYGFEAPSCTPATDYGLRADDDEVYATHYALQIIHVLPLLLNEGVDVCQQALQELEAGVAEADVGAEDGGV